MATPSQNIAAQLDRIEHNLRLVQEEGAERGRRIWEEINNQGQTLAVIKHRVDVVEKSVAGQAPTIAEVTAMRHRAEGAGWLGRNLWKLAVTSIGFAGWVYSARETIAHWLTGR